MKKIYISVLKYLLTIIATTLVTSGIIYAANIISVTQTAVTGDKMTAQWVNEVNSKIRNLETQASGGNYGLLCIQNGSQGNPSSFTAINTYTNLYGPPDMYYCGITLTINNSFGYIQPQGMYTKGSCPGTSYTDSLGNTTTTPASTDQLCWIVKQ